MASRFFVVLILVGLVGSLAMQATEPQQRGYPLTDDAPTLELQDFQPLGSVPADGDTLPELLKEQVPEDDLVGGAIHEFMRANQSIVDRFPTEQDLGLEPVQAPSQENQRERAIAAEQLLKSARLLENLSAIGDEHVDLIGQLRVEAGRLLAE